MLALFSAFVDRVNRGDGPDELLDTRITEVLGEGAFGVAFHLDDGSVLKLTVSELEADCVRRTEYEGFGHHFPDIYNHGHFGPDARGFWYVREPLDDIPHVDPDLLQAAIEDLTRHGVVPLDPAPRNFGVRPGLDPTVYVLRDVDCLAADDPSTAPFPDDAGPVGRRTTGVRRDPVPEPDHPLEDLVPVGSSKWFEYHCTESHTSDHAHLWYRSQQPVIVLGLTDGFPEAAGTTIEERGEWGVPLVYRVRFTDGYEDEVFEDELLDDPSEFCRPAPPGPPATTGARDPATELGERLARVVTYHRDLLPFETRARLDAAFAAVRDILPPEQVAEIAQAILPLDLLPPEMRPVSAELATQTFPARPVALDRLARRLQYILAEYHAGGLTWPQLVEEAHGTILRALEQRPLPDVLASVIPLQLADPLLPPVLKEALRPAATTEIHEDTPENILLVRILRACENLDARDCAFQIVPMLREELQRGELDPNVLEEAMRLLAHYEVGAFAEPGGDLVRWLRPSLQETIALTRRRAVRGTGARGSLSRSATRGKTVGGDAPRKAAWEMTEEEYVARAIELNTRRLERQLAESREQLGRLSSRAFRQRKDMELRIVLLENMLAEYHAGETESLRRDLVGHYIREVEAAIKTDRDVPEAIIASRLEFTKARDARERYLKGRATSFANVSAAVDASMLAERGYKVKRQDGRPITEAQKAEIARGIDEVEAVLGPLAEAFRSTWLTIAHTSGKYPFLMSDAGGLYSSDDRTVTMGIASNVTGLPIQALAHELGHWMDYEAGRMLGITSVLPGRSGKVRRGSAISNYEGGYFPGQGADPAGGDLIRWATSMFTSEDRFVERLMKLRKKDLREDAARMAEAEWAKIKLGTYWRSPVEVWARLVEQFVAHRLAYQAGLVSVDHRYPHWLAYWSTEEMDLLAPAVGQQIQRRLNLILSHRPDEEAAP